MSERVETGVVQFGDDWPGVFIRGDDAALWGITLDSYLAAHLDTVDEVALGGLRDMLLSVSVRADRYVRCLPAPDTGGEHG